MLETKKEALDFLVLSPIGCVSDLNIDKKVLKELIDKKWLIVEGDKYQLIFKGHTIKNTEDLKYQVALFVEEKLDKSISSYFEKVAKKFG